MNGKRPAGSGKDESRREIRAAMTALRGEAAGRLLMPLPDNG